MSALLDVTPPEGEHLKLSEHLSGFRAAKSQSRAINPTLNAVPCGRAAVTHLRHDGGREVISEASKLFSQLGFSNLVRALRVRYGDGKQKDLDMAALASEKVELEKRLRALQGGK